MGDASSKGAASPSHIRGYITCLCHMPSSPLHLHDHPGIEVPTHMGEEAAPGENHSILKKGSHNSFSIQAINEYLLIEPNQQVLYCYNMRAIVMLISLRTILLIIKVQLCYKIKLIRKTNFKNFLTILYQVDLLSFVSG